MALPLLMLAGGAMAAGGLAGAYGSGSMGRGRRVEAPQVNQAAYYWGGSAGAAEAERQRLQGYEEQGRGLALGARQGQQDAAGMYREMALGRGPSAGQAMLSAGMSRANQDAANLAASARGGGGSRQAAMRAALDAQAGNAAEAANRAALLRAQEQQAGIAGLASTSGQMRGMDQQLVASDLDAATKRQLERGASIACL